MIALPAALADDDADWTRLRSRRAEPCRADADGVHVFVRHPARWRCAWCGAALVADPAPLRCAAAPAEGMAA